MNILFFLTPKAMCAYIESDDTLRQAMERMEHSGYAALPVIDKSGKYCGVVTEGDLLWGIKNMTGLSIEAAEDVPITRIPRRRDYEAVPVTTGMEQLVNTAMNQNFVPVVDDRKNFIGLVRRKDILRYCYGQAEGRQQAKALAQPKV